MKKTNVVRDEAVAWLRACVEPGSTLYTTMTHVAKSGISRRIKVFMVVPDEGGGGDHQIWNISGWVAEATNRKKHSTEMSVVVNGCGMDMGFELVYTLGRALFPDGFVPAKCGKLYGRNGTPATEVDEDGGYAINQRWI